MKIRGKVQSAVKTSEHLIVTVRGVGAGDAQWSSMREARLEMSYTEKNRRAYYIGREVVVDLTPVAETSS